MRYFFDEDTSKNIEELHNRQREDSSRTVSAGRKQPLTSRLTNLWSRDVYHVKNFLYSHSFAFKELRSVFQIIIILFISIKKQTNNYKFESVE